MNRRQYSCECFNVLNVCTGANNACKIRAKDAYDDDLTEKITRSYEEYVDRLLSDFNADKAEPPKHNIRYSRSTNHNKYCAE